LARPGEDPGSASQLLFLLVTLAIWIGSIDSAREIIKERAVFSRERAVGVRISAYLMSKVTVLFTLAAVQTVLLTVIVFALRPLHESGGRALAILGLLILTSWVAVAMGLLLSAWVNTENQATSFIPLALIPQLLFAGQIKGITELPTVMKGLAALIFARWAFPGVGHLASFNDRISETRDPAVAAAQMKHYGHKFFDLSAGVSAAILLLFLTIFLSGAAAGLRRRRT
ncbi:MAG: transport system ATP-binding/permease protein, partial [Thermoleophilaceae bacterium]|nr:transport system ATP-binding/permease protein [Thermoleophilaceae bacterium]